MNLLVDALPTAVLAGGRRFAVQADFRSCLRIILAYEDPELTPQEKQWLLLRLFYVDEIPPDPRVACELAVKFLNCDQDAEAEEEAPERLYSFAQDASYIYAAIRQTHGVDLTTSPALHWWVFCSLFSDLREDSFFSRLVNIRYKQRQGSLSKEEKRWYAQMRQVVDLPEVLGEEEQSAVEGFMRLLKR